MESNIYGKCECCNSYLTPIWFIEKERNKYNSTTGRKRKACSHLICSSCGKNYCVDDSFDGNWY